MLPHPGHLIRGIRFDDIEQLDVDYLVSLMKGIDAYDVDAPLARKVIRKVCAFYLPTLKIFRALIYGLF